MILAFSLLPTSYTQYLNFFEQSRLRNDEGQPQIEGHWRMQRYLQTMLAKDHF